MTSCLSVSGSVVGTSAGFAAEAVAEFESEVVVEVDAEGTNTALPQLAAATYVHNNDLI